MQGGMKRGRQGGINPHCNRPSPHPSIGLYNILLGKTPRIDFGQLYLSNSTKESILLCNSIDRCFVHPLLRSSRGMDTRVYKGVFKGVYKVLYQFHLVGLGPFPAPQMRRGPPGPNPPPTPR